MLIIVSLADISSGADEVKVPLFWSTVTRPAPPTIAGYPSLAECLPRPLGTRENSQRKLIVNRILVKHQFILRHVMRK